MTPVLRTPDERFADLPDWPYSPQYLEDLPGFAGMRLAYVDEGPRKAKECFLCLHGQPTWGYLYRKMMAPWLAAGHRVVVPDLFGFGRSDKPADAGTFTFDFHRRTLLAFVERLRLRGVTLVLHDWGGILGLTLPPDLETSTVRRLVVTNTMLTTGDLPVGRGFLAWKAWVARQPDMDVARLMGRACPQLSPEEQAAYNAPFPDVRYKAGIRRFPGLVPLKPEDSGAVLARRAKTWWKESWNGPTYVAAGLQDTVIDAESVISMVRQLHPEPTVLRLEKAGHFVPEWGQEVATSVLAAFGLAK